MTSPTPRPEILTIHPYVGGESTLSGVNRTIKLSSNEGAFGVPPGAQAAIHKATTCAPQIRFEKRGRANAIKAAEFELRRARDHCTGAIIHAGNGETAINDTPRRFINVPVADACAAFGDHRAVGKSVGIACGAADGQFDLVIAEDTHRVRIQRKGTETVERAHR